MPLDSPAYTIHAEGDSRGSLSIVTHSAFAALGAYRRLRRANWPVILVTGGDGRMTDEAGLLREVSLSGADAAARPGPAAAAL